MRIAEPVPNRRISQAKVVRFCSDRVELLFCGMSQLSVNVFKTAKHLLSNIRIVSRD